MSDGKNGFEKTKHNFPYKWTLKDAVFTKDKGKVFSCFACGGGSTMGYKLAGFDVLGCNEIDPKMIEAYKANHNPKYAYLEPIQTFNPVQKVITALTMIGLVVGTYLFLAYSQPQTFFGEFLHGKLAVRSQAQGITELLNFCFVVGIDQVVYMAGVINIAS